MFGSDVGEDRQGCLSNSEKGIARHLLDWISDCLFAFVSLATHHGSLADSQRHLSIATTY